MQTGQEESIENLSNSIRDLNSLALRTVAHAAEDNFLDQSFIDAGISAAQCLAIIRSARTHLTRLDVGDKEINISGSHIFGKNLRTARKNTGMTMEDLAERTGIKQPQISSYELGKHMPSERNIRRLAKALGLNPEHLI